MARIEILQRVSKFSNLFVGYGEADVDILSDERGAMDNAREATSEDEIDVVLKESFKQLFEVVSHDIPVLPPEDRLPAGGPLRELRSVLHERGKGYVQ